MTADRPPSFPHSPPGDDATERPGSDPSARRHDAAAAGEEPAAHSISEETDRFPGPGAAPTQPALVSIMGKSDSGKTTMVERLVPELTGLGFLVGSVKHDAHDFEIDHPGKDSYRHGAAGSRAYAVVSPVRLAYVMRLAEELPLRELARRFFPGFDIVVAEGYKREAPHRVEVFRRAAGHAAPLLGPQESLAILTDIEVEHPHRFGLDDIAGLAAFIAARLDTLREY